MIHERDSKYAGPFDEVFHTEGVKVIHTPIRAPQANAFAERWVRTECLDWTLVLGGKHLERVIRPCSSHYNQARPHRGLDLATPEVCKLARGRRKRRVGVLRSDILGGLVHEYDAAA